MEACHGVNQEAAVRTKKPRCASRNRRANQKATVRIKKPPCELRERPPRRTDIGTAARLACGPCGMRCRLANAFPRWLSDEVPGPHTGSLRMQPKPGVAAGLVLYGVASRGRHGNRINSRLTTGRREYGSGACVLPSRQTAAPGRGVAPAGDACAGTARRCWLPAPLRNTASTLLLYARCGRPRAVAQRRR